MKSHSWTYCYEQRQNNLENLDSSFLTHCVLYQNMVKLLMKNTRNE